MNNNTYTTALRILRVVRTCKGVEGWIQALKHALTQAFTVLEGADASAKAGVDTSTDGVNASVNYGVNASLHVGANGAVSASIKAGIHASMHASAQYTEEFNRYCIR